MITDNRKAKHYYFIEDRFEAGIMLQGWEVKAIRAKRVSIGEAYVIVKDGSLHLLNATITPLLQASTHLNPEPSRTRQLLLNKSEIEKMITKVTRAGYTIVPLNLHFTNGKVKVEIGLAKGKKQHDKRDVEQERDVKRDIARAMKGDRNE
jgi:SsrA-binding protein